MRVLELTSAFLNYRNFSSINTDIQLMILILDQTYRSLYLNDKKRSLLADFCKLLVE